MLDYRLPDSNDLTLLATVRRLSPESAVVLMTAFGTPEIAKAALDLGVYQVLHKPFEMHDLRVAASGGLRFRRSVALRGFLTGTLPFAGRPFAGSNRRDAWRVRLAHTGGIPTRSEIFRGWLCIGRAHWFDDVGLNSGFAQIPWFTTESPMGPSRTSPMAEPMQPAYMKPVVIGGRLHTLEVYRECPEQHPGTRRFRTGI